MWSDLEGKWSGKVYNSRFVKESLNLWRKFIKFCKGCDSC